MARRAIAAAAITMVLGCGLTGCAQRAPGTLTRTVAQADVAAWTKQALVAAHSSSTTTKLNAFETCRTDTSYFATTFQWRTITNVGVAGGDQATTTKAIEAAFEQAQWKLSMPQGVVTLTGPGSQKRRGVITIQAGGPTQLAISVTSPCYS